MATKGCIAALNARLNAQPMPYDGNRKFKRLSKKKDEQGRVVRTFADNVHTFKIIGDGPYEILLEINAGAPIPAFATAHLSKPAAKTTAQSAQQTVGYFQEDEGQFTLVLKDFWDEHGGVDPDAELDDMLPEGFYNLADATFEYEGDPEEGADVLRQAGFKSRRLN
jgi:hypothetical protein